MSGYYSPERRWDQPLVVKIDFDQLILQALQMVNTAFQSPEFRMQESHNKAGGSTESHSKISMDRFENSVLLVQKYIQPEWIEEDNSKFPARYAKWVKLFTDWIEMRNKWLEEFHAWEKGPTVPMTKEAWEAWKPPEPPPPIKPVLYSQQIEEAKILMRVNGGNEISVVKPFQLYEAIIGLLHRRGFFETKHRRAKL